MAKRKLEDKLIDKEDIQEELRLILGSETDYITPSGEIYKDYGNGKFFHKAQWLNWGYWYCGITYPEGQRQKRVHILVAEAYVPNPNNLPIVMHIDDNKANKHYTNLQWGTVSENTCHAYEIGDAHNDKGWDDSQSKPVCCFNLEKELIATYGSIGEASRNTGITKGVVSQHCLHKIKGKPRKGYYFRFLSEVQKEDFVL